MHTILVLQHAFGARQDRQVIDSAQERQLKHGELVELLSVPGLACRQLLTARQPQVARCVVRVFLGASYVSASLTNVQAALAGPTFLNELVQ